MKKSHNDSRIEHEEAVLLLPWYVTGRLAENDATRMQRHLAECEDCSEEAAMQQALKSEICNRPSVDYTPQASLSKLMERIDAQEERRRARRVWSSWLNFPRSFAPRRSARAWIRTLTIATGVQALTIVALLAVVGWFAFRSAPPAPYRTLTSATDASVIGDAAVRVVFDESLRLTEMQSLLRSIDARIVAGPTSVGAYTLRVDLDDGTARTAADVAEWLRLQPGVRFAEPVIRRE